MIRDDVLAMCELRNDLLYRRIPDYRRRYYVDCSLSFGFEAAKKLKGRCKTPDMEALYREFGIEIIFQEKSAKNYGVSFRAQSEYGKDGSAKVFIYRDSIALLAQQSAKKLCFLEQSPPGMDEKTALAVHLSHEFFHYLEYNSSEVQNKKTKEIYGGGFVSDALEPVELTRILGLKRKGSILRCSEIAAHAFAKEMMGLTVLPNFYDYVYLIAERKIAQDSFREMLAQNEELLR